MDGNVIYLAHISNRGGMGSADSLPRGNVFNVCHKARVELSDYGNTENVP